MAELQITEFTDPACPFAWSAEPRRRRLEWLYGDQLGWEVRMVGLSSSADEYTDKGFTPERLSSSLRSLAERHHMPMDTALRPRMSATVPETTGTAMLVPLMVHGRPIGVMADQVFSYAASSVVRSVSVAPGAIEFTVIR